MSTMGTSTMRFPSMMVSTACHQFMPPSTSPAASMYVGMQTDSPTHSDAMW
jgi:hypothetical protein